MITLHHTAGSHLWTVAPEVKYYFFIPVYAFFTSKMNKRTISKWIWILMEVIFLFFVEYFNLINKFDSSGNYTRPAHEFLTRFTTFFLGSYVASIVLIAQDMDLYRVNAEKNCFRNIFGIFSMLVYLYGMILFSATITPSLREGIHFFPTSLYWTFFILMFIMGKDNFFSRIFNGNFCIFVESLVLVFIYFIWASSALFTSIIMIRSNLNLK